MLVKLNTVIFLSTNWKRVCPATRGITFTWHAGRRRPLRPPTLFVASWAEISCSARHLRIEVALFQFFLVGTRNQEITEKFPAPIIRFVSHHLTVYFPPRVVMLQRASVHILQCLTTATPAHMRRQGTIKEQTTVTHDHNLLIWVCITRDRIASHVL